MAASVKSLGYLIVNSTDLDAWEQFGSGLLGLQASVKTPERLEFRADEKEYRRQSTSPSATASKPSAGRSAARPNWPNWWTPCARRDSASRKWMPRP